MFSATKKLRQERLGSKIDLFDNGPNDVDGLASGIVEFPVHIPLSRIDRTGIATAHGDDDVGFSGPLVGQGLGELLARIKASRNKERDDGRVEVVSGLGTS
jgi:hypothetical protein